MHEPIEHWVKEWKGKHQEKDPPAHKKVTGCTNCTTGAAYFQVGPKGFVCGDCVASWYPDKTPSEISLFFEAQEVELERVKAHEAYKRKPKCARCGDVVERSTGRGVYCGSCFDLAGKLKEVEA